MSKKKIIVIGILIGLLLLISLINLFDDDNISDKLDSYFSSSGYTHSDGSNLYYKRVSELSLDKYNEKVNNKEDASYERYCFNSENFTLTKTDYNYEDEVLVDFTPIYSYKNNSFTYNYRIVIGNTGIMYKGYYYKKTDDFSCEKVYYNGDDKLDEDIICDKIKYDMETFYYEMLQVINNPTLVDLMRK